MDLEEMTEKSQWTDQPKGRLGIEKYPFLRHPKFLPNNPWIWKFIPGVVVGFLGCLLLFSNRLRRKRTSRDPYSDIDGIETFSSRQPPVDVKLMLVINGELKAMKPGKMGAQCGHAAGMVMKKLLRHHSRLLASWEQCGTKKICVRGLSTQQLEFLSERARECNILVTPVFDAGKTQVQEGSLTVVAIGPAEAEKLHPITGNLKLMS